MKKYHVVDTHVDTLGIRCECNSKEERDYLFNNIVYFISNAGIAGVVYDQERSTKYYQIMKLQYANSTLATISKGYFENNTNGYKMEYYYININFYGLMRYSKIKDDASQLLLRTISAYLNTTHVDFRLTELDIAMDIRSKIDNILAICIRQSANVDYYQLGDIDKNGNTIQENAGTYNIEKFTSYKKRKNAMSRAYLYDKRLKELEKFKRNIGFALTRFEVKLQKRYFVKNDYCTGIMYKKLNKYAVLLFKDAKQKEIIIQKCNDTNSSKKRREIIEEALNNNDATLLRPRMDKVGSFLREIDTIKFDNKMEFLYTKQEDYLYGRSKFNRKY